jgi:hypothetical protein
MATGKQLTSCRPKYGKVTSRLVGMSHKSRTFNKVYGYMIEAVFFQDWKVFSKHSFGLLVYKAGRSLTGLTSLALVHFAFIGFKFYSLHI